MNASHDPDSDADSVKPVSEASFFTCCVKTGQRYPAAGFRNKWPAFRTTLGHIRAEQIIARAYKGDEAAE